MNTHTHEDSFGQRLKCAVQQQESGQVILLMAFGMIVLLAAVGLAIDGGRLVYLKRDAQNATDAAALASTYALCSSEAGTTVENAGLEASIANGFANGTNATVTVNSPPQHNENAIVNGDATYVEVIIEAKVPAYFMRLMGRSELTTTSYGVGHCNAPDAPPSLASYEAAVLTFGEGCDTAIDFNGSEGHYSTIVGNLVSNKDVLIRSAGDIEGTIQTLAGSGQRTGSGTMTDDGRSTFTTALEPEPYLFNIEDYAPGGPKEAFINASFPGENLYHSYDQTNKVQFNHETLEGLYYFSEITDTIQFVGVDIGPKGATFVAYHDLDVSATKDTQFTPFIDDLLVFSLVPSEGCNTSGNNVGSFKISGFTYWEGLIYVPLGYVDLPGSGVEGYGSVIANDFSTRVSGGTIRYKPGIIPEPDIEPLTIELSQ